MIADGQLLGIAGVHLVCAELTLRGYIAVLTSRNTEGIDILVSNKEGNKLKSIQVKTTRKNKDWYKFSDSLIKKTSDNFIFILVDINKDNKVEFHIVPSKIISEAIKKNPSAGTFKDRENKYLNLWDLLGLD